MYKFGLKLWSTNTNYIEEAKRLFIKGIFQYIELYIIPNSFDKIEIWKNINIPYIIHAPHYNNGLNLAKKECETSNIILANEAINFANKLKAEYIIFHPGIDGDIAETARQLNEIINKFNEKRILVENKPYYALVNNLICNGSSPEEIIFLIRKTGISFCLDIGHAICAANAKKIDPFVYINEFIKLMPKMFHLTDGIYEAIYDKHLHFNDGNYPVEKFVKSFIYDTLITNESPKSSLDNLDDFERDITILKGLICK